MKKLVYLLFLAGSAVLVTFYGGNISYLLFYFALLLPLLTLIYSLYVFFRFKIVQEVERNVIKGQKVPYRLKLANEDPIPFTNISLNYHTDMVALKEWTNAGGSDPDISADSNDFCLFSHQQICIDTKMYCKYRGTYPVGVKSVSVTDFLGLFTITYPMKEQVRLTAKPRIIPFEHLSLCLQEKDPKNNLYSVSKLQDLPDFELRQYHPGDQQKYIHWKNSAKAGELLVRKQMPEELFETVIIMDLSPIEGEKETRLKTEDTIIETAISFAHNCFLKKIPVRIVYMEEQLQEILIDARTGFDTFYDLCAILSFCSALPLEQVWMEYTGKIRQNRAVVLITSYISDALRLSLEESRRIGHEAILIDTGDLSL